MELGIISLGGVALGEVSLNEQPNLGIIYLGGKNIGSIALPDASLNTYQKAGLRLIEYGSLRLSSFGLRFLR